MPKWNRSQHSIERHSIRLKSMKDQLNKVRLSFSCFEWPENNMNKSNEYYTKSLTNKNNSAQMTSIKWFFKRRMQTRDSSIGRVKENMKIDENLQESNGFTPIEHVAHLRKSFYATDCKNDIKYKSCGNKEAFNNTTPLSESLNKKPTYVISDRTMVKNERRK